MRYLLDANACIRILNDSSRNLVERLRRHQPSEIVVCSVVRAELIYGAQKSSRVGPNDLLIAATARAHGLILVSHNLKEFRRVDGLKIEDWEEEPS